MKYLAALLAVLLATFAAVADDPLAVRAARAYAAGEWTSAQAMYAVLADREPGRAEYYAKALVAASAAGDSLTAIDMAASSMAAAVPPDSLLDIVRAESYGIVKPEIYPRLLDVMSLRLPYMKRAIMLRKLNYYRDRNDAPNTIACAEALLTGIPDNVRFLTVLAEARFANGQPEQAMAVYSRILELEPQNYEALVALANYYDARGLPEALEYFRRAQQVRPTPYVSERINQLSKQ